MDERTRIAREIHDAVGHSLTSLIVQLQALRYMIEADQSQAKQAVEEMLTVARQGLTDIRTSVHALADDHSALGITPLQALVSKINATTHLKCTLLANAQSENMILLADDQTMIRQGLGYIIKMQADMHSVSANLAPPSKLD